MGVSWGIGCVKCKVFVDMGAQKAYRWKDPNYIRDTIKFIINHNSNDENACKLFVGNDLSYDYWIVDEENWQEDILSRTFSDHTAKNKGECAHCKQKLNKQHELLKNSRLIFCSKQCFLAYKEEALNSIWFDYKDIFDSSGVYKNIKEEDVRFRIECTQCNELFIVGQNNFELLAEFLQDHTGVDHKHIVCQVIPKDK